MTDQRSIQIVDFQDTHMDSAVSGLLKVRKSDPTYPPPQDVDNTAKDFQQWILNDEPIFRLVALDGNVVAGHISAVPAHDYLLNYCATQNYATSAINGFGEISKFFVNPDYQKHGVGDALFQEALSLLKEREFHPALAVISTSVKAIRFYRKHGLLELGSFNGFHGKNFVFVG